MAQEQKQTSQFGARADNAALALRQSLQQQGAAIADSRPVEVGPDGKPPQPLPPEGSYARNAIEQARAQQERQPIGDQPPAGTQEQAIDGSQAPRLPESQPPQDQHDEQAPSPNAQRRIRDLIEELRRKDQELQQHTSISQQQGETLAQLQARLEAVEREREQLVQANLDHMDPETRMSVLQDARIREHLASLEQRIMGQLMPHIQNLDQKNKHAEMLRLSETYPAFDLQIHGPLIDMFRGKNPSCSIEQAFRAIAEDDELVTRAQARAQHAVPPVLPPGSSSAATRYAPQPEQQSDPEQELREESLRLKKLMASSDPNDHRAGMRLAHDHIANRLSHRLPGR